MHEQIVDVKIKLEKLYADSLAVSWKECAMERPQRIYFNREDFVDVTCKQVGTNRRK